MQLQTIKDYVNVNEKNPSKKVLNLPPPQKNVAQLAQSQ